MITKKNKKKRQQHGGLLHLVVLLHFISKISEFAKIKTLINEYQQYIRGNFNEKWLSLLSHGGDNWYFLNSTTGLKNWINTMIVYLYLKPKLKEDHPISQLKSKLIGSYTDKSAKINEPPVSKFIPDSHDETFIIRVVLFKLILNNYCFRLNDFSFSILSFKVFDFYSKPNTSVLSINDLLTDQSVLSINDLLTDQSVLSINDLLTEQVLNFYQLKDHISISTEKNSLLLSEKQIEIDTTYSNLLIKLRNCVVQEKSKDCLKEAIGIYLGGRVSLDNLSHEIDDNKDFIIETQLLIIYNLLLRLNSTTINNSMDFKLNSASNEKRVFQFKDIFPDDGN